MQRNTRLDIRIVPMLDIHLDAVAEIEREVFLNPWTRDMYKAELMKSYSHHFVMLNGEEVVGYYGFFNTDEHCAEVTNVAIKGSYQGDGLGKMMLSNMLANAVRLDIDEIFLETRFTNDRARHLYEKFGFVLVNIRKKYYDGVEDACIYRWTRVK